MDEDSSRAAAKTLAELAPRLGRIIANALDSDPAIALSLRQYRMLERLAERPHRTGELATSSGIKQPTATAAVASLESRGLVERQPDPIDKRASLIKLTAAGEAMLAAAKQRVLQRLTIVTAEMTEDDATALAALQPVLTKGMDRLRDQLRTAPPERSA